KARDSESPLAGTRESMRSRKSNVSTGSPWRNIDEKKQPALQGLTRCVEREAPQCRFDLPPGGRASSGAVGRAEGLGHHTFVSLRDGEGEQRTAGTHDAVRASNLRKLKFGAHFGQAFAADA